MHTTSTPRRYFADTQSSDGDFVRVMGYITMFILIKTIDIAIWMMAVTSNNGKRDGIYQYTVVNVLTPAIPSGANTNVNCLLIDQWHSKYRQTNNISRTKSQILNVFRLALQLSLINLLKSGIKSRMKM